MSEITIVNYGVGNLGSIQNMLKKIGANYIVSSSPKDIERAEKILLPGVGAYDAAIKNLHEQNYFEILNKRVAHDKVPILGICLGMQLLTESSDEGQEPGFGWIKGTTKKFDLKEHEDDLKVPHMGWNFINPTQESPLIAEMDENYRFYFVHSYYVECSDKKNVIATASHGTQFDAIIQNENVFGAQFHPEKSHKFGMKLLTNFANNIQGA